MPRREHPERGIERRRPRQTGPVEDYEPDEADPDEPQEQDLERFGDVTVRCRECGTELYDDVAVCWKCGRAVMGGDQSKGMPMWAVLAVIATLAAFGLALLLNVI
jgi:hypothetical protein